jgi:hypothetical protein
MDLHPDLGAGLCISRPQAAASGLGLLSMFTYSDPYENVQLISCIMVRLKGGTYAAH